MTTDSSCYDLKSIKDYSDALESIRMISKAVSLVEQGNIVENFSVYEEAFENLGRSLAAAKTKGNLSPQLQRANAKLEGLVGQLSQRVELASARVKQATSASFATRMVDWVSAKAPKERMITVMQTAGVAGQWAWRHKKTVVGGAVLGVAIYNDAIGMLRTAVDTAGVLWECLKAIPELVRQFQQNGGVAANEFKQGFSNVGTLATEAAFPLGVGQELLLQNIKKCRNGESVAACVDAIMDTFSAIKDCMPSADESFDMKKWFWCVDNRVSGGTASSVKQFQDERISQVVHTGLNIFLHVLAFRVLGINMPGGNLFNKMVSPWIHPNLFMSAIYPQYLEDLRVYCSSHPFICTPAILTAGLYSGPLGVGIGMGGAAMDASWESWKDPIERTGQQISDSLLETPQLSFGLGVGLPSTVLAVSKYRVATAAAVALGAEVMELERDVEVATNILRALEAYGAALQSMIPPNIDAVASLANRQLANEDRVHGQGLAIAALQARIPAARAAIPKYIPSWKQLTGLGFVGFVAPKIATKLYSANSVTDLVVAQAEVNNAWTMITTAIAMVVAGALPRLLPQLADAGLRVAVPAGLLAR